MYFQSGDQTLFGWAHSVNQVPPFPVATIICNPLGVEYMSGHRAIRHFADGLARIGIKAIRFDYARTGDSSGGSFTEASIAGIIQDIRAAINFTKQLYSYQHIALLGIGLGATFAALAAEREKVDSLIMWNPTVSGARFVREQMLFSDVLSDGEKMEPGIIDVAGVLLTASLQDEFKSIDLTTLDYSRISSLLLLERHDRRTNQKLLQAISDGKCDFDRKPMAGYTEMMDQPTDTVVPVTAIRAVCDWLQSQYSETIQNQSSRATEEESAGQNVAMRLPASGPAAENIVEIREQFGVDGSLFGIVSVLESRTARGDNERAFLFLNCGSEHHAGPHRMYTRLARLCAGLGMLSFRFDIEGIGDSFTIGNNEDNNSYSPTALKDIDSALQFITDKYGTKEFVLSGICAGAYHSFKAAATLDRHNIVEANLVNPLVFEWNYDDPDDHLLYETHTYRASIRDPKNWRRLFTGDINYSRLVRSFSRNIMEFSIRAVSQIAEVFFKRQAAGLPLDMQKIAKLRRSLNLILSEGDPGLNIMRLQARRETKEALTRNDLKLHILKNANHGLSKKPMQDQLISFFADKYRPDS